MNKSKSFGALVKQLFASSVIVRALLKISDFVYDGAKKSLVGRILSGKSRLSSGHSGLLHTLYDEAKIKERFVIPTKRFFSSAVSGSRILKIFSNFMRSLLAVKVNLYGATIAIFGLGSALAFAVRRFISADGSENIINLYFGAAAVLIALPLLFCRQTLSEAIFDSKIASALLFRVLGLSETGLKSRTAPISYPYFAIIFGIVLGVASAFVNPILIVLALAAAVFAYTVLVRPESGVIVTIFALPFLPTMAVAALNILTLVSFFFKYICGKRSIRLCDTDTAILLFAIMMLFGGFVSVSSADSLRPALLYTSFILGYFAMVNLIRNREWAMRCVYAIVSSSFVVALIGVYEYFFGSAQSTWTDTTMFTDISGRVVSTFQNPNVLAEYLIMVLPISFALLICAKKPSGRIASLAVFAATALCLVFTYSRGAWLGIIFGFAVFFLIYSRKFFAAVPVAILSIPFLPFVLPSSVISRFTSIGNLADSSTAYRVNIWKGVLSMVKKHFVGGIGVGASAFSAVYPKYSLSGIEAAPHSHNLYLQILVEIGIFGLVLFLAVLFMHAKENFTYFAHCSEDPPGTRLLAAACYSGIIAVLVQGMTDYIWYNYRVFFMFWIAIAVGNTVMRTAKDERPVYTPEGYYKDLDFEK